MAATCLALPETREEDAWAGVRWRVRQRTFAQVCLVAEGGPEAYARAAGSDGPALVLVFWATSDEAGTPGHLGPPYFQPDWGEVAEPLIDSYCDQAPPQAGRAGAPSGWLEVRVIPDARIATLSGELVPMGFISTVKRRVATRLLTRSTRNGIDLRKLRFLPDSVTMPLKRVGLDPLPEMAEVRAEAPIKRIAEMFGKGIWLVSGYDEARALLANGAALSNDLGQFVSQEGRGDSEQIGGLGMTDPPAHTALRRYLTPEFTMHRLARLQPVIERIVDARLDAMADRGPDIDLVDQFAFPIPFEVICELLDLPVADRARFHSLGAARFDLSQGGAGVFGAAAHTREFLISSVAKQRQDPGEGLIGGLLRDHGDELDDLTLGGLADGVFLGGYETSASMLALGTYLLAQHPEAMAIMREGDDQAVDRVVEELLRHLTVVQLAFVRFARDDMEIAGAQIKAGDVLGISLLGANRDPSLTPDPDTFDPHRASTRHLAFGHGIHRCVGAELARMELRTALRGLARRFPDLRITADPTDLEFRKLSAVYGVESLPVRLYDDTVAPLPVS